MKSGYPVKKPFFLKCLQIDFVKISFRYFFRKARGMIIPSLSLLSMYLFSLHWPFPCDSPTVFNNYAYWSGDQSIILVFLA